MARSTGSSGCSRGATVSSRYSAMAFDSNNDWDSSTRKTGTFLCGEMARNQSGRLSGSMWRNSNAIFFSRSTIAARCTQGQVLKLTSRYFAILASDPRLGPYHDFDAPSGRAGVNSDGDTLLTTHGGEALKEPQLSGAVARRLLHGAAVRQRGSSSPAGLAAPRQPSRMARMASADRFEPPSVNTSDCWKRMT